MSVFQAWPYTVWGLTERVLRQFMDYAGETPAGESFDDDRPPRAGSDEGYFAPFGRSHMSSRACPSGSRKKHIHRS